MPLHAFIDFLSWSPGAHRSAGCGLRGGPRRRQGSRPGHYTLPQCPDGGSQHSSAPLAAAVCLLIAASTLWIRQQLVPHINQLRDAELAGDAAAGARFATLHRASVIINMVQLLALVVLLFKY